MTLGDVAALTTSVLAGLAAVISALATLVTAIRQAHEIAALGKGLNGRLDMLLAEREARVRAEAAAEIEQLRVRDLGQLGQQDRSTVRIERVSPADDDRRPAPG